MAFELEIITAAKLASVNVRAEKHGPDELVPAVDLKLTIEPAAQQRALSFWKCEHHGPAKSNAWGCPECTKELREENARLKQQLADSARMDWLEQHGGLIGIRHVAYGDYADYAGQDFKPLREVVDELMTPNVLAKP